MKHKMLKLLSLILAVIMTVQLIPQSVFSAAAQSISEALEEETIIYENEESENETVDEQENELTVIGEDKSRREANVKHYIMSDGSMMAVSYSQDVHYEENGEWIDIDNSLSEEDAKDSEMGLIKNELIDGASIAITDECDALYELSTEEV